MGDAAFPRRGDNFRTINPADRPGLREEAVALIVEVERAQAAQRSPELNRLPEAR